MDKNFKMFCYQCQEAAGNTGCTMAGVCGKNADVAALQDALIYVTRGFAEVAEKLRKQGVPLSKEQNKLVSYNLFVTITNANFDSDSITNDILKTAQEKETMIAKLTTPYSLSDAALWNPKDTTEIIKKAPEVGVMATSDTDIRSLRWFVIYGLKGIAAYNAHANTLGYFDDFVDAFMQAALAKTLDNSLTVNDLVGLALETGKFGVDVMALLDKANTSTYGNPTITNVSIGVKNNPSILISGHDLHDLESLLKQTEGSGIDVYTHGEMLPAHYYPAFKKYKNFIGNYGNAWWQQKEEFEKFNGPILLTTNCLVPPSLSYKDRIYTTGAVGYPGCTHIVPNKDGMKDFSVIKEHAKKCASPTQIETGSIVGGFAHNQVLALADQIVDAVQTGAIKKFVVMAGCDGRHKSRSYYTEFAENLPKDTVILTAGCAKYRYNKLNLGDINGIPRVLDAGQCNDSYSLAVIALKLQEVFKLKDINELPIVYNIAWYEQKAVLVLLALLHLGIKNIHLGPTLPAFLSPNVAKTVIEAFDLSGIDSVQNDIEHFFFI